jgi:putative cardiolipin synthase
MSSLLSRLSARAGVTSASLLLAAAFLGGCASLPAHVPMPPSHAIADVAATQLARIAQANAGPEAAALSGFRLLPEAPTSFNARIALARRAEKSLDVQYYELRDDGVGRQLLRELGDAARRGVRVRLLVDDLYIGHAGELFGTLAAHPGIEVRLFNPLPVRAGSLLTRLAFSLHELRRINHRMHNKLFVADNSFSISGGRNIADEYFMQDGTANFIDMDVLASGPVVREQSAAFDLYWNSDQVRPLPALDTPSVTPEQARLRFNELVSAEPAGLTENERDGLGRTPVARQLDDRRLDQSHAPALVLVDDPAKIQRRRFEERFAGSVTQRTLAALETARSSLFITSPYYVPGDIGFAQAKRQIERGVRITVVTNSLAATDEPLVYAGYARYRRALLELGVVLYEFSPALSQRSGRLGHFGRSTGRLHGKTAVIDDERVFVGSMNLDGRSASLNTEIGLLIDSPALARDIARIVALDGFTSAYQVRLGPTGSVEWVERDSDGKVVKVHTDEPETNWLVQFKNWLLSPFVHEELL